MKIKLLTSYYECKNEHRQKEYLTCLKENLSKEFIDEIVLFIMDNLADPGYTDQKITYVENPEHTYRSYIEYCNEHLKGEICVIANSDMILDESIKQLEHEDMSERFLCLTRWNIKDNGETEFYRPPHGSEKSQDVWIFKSPIAIDTSEANIPLAHQGCDSRIAMVALKSGLKVSNPSLKIKVNHLHLVDYRTTAGDRKKRVLGDYLFVEPSDSVIQPANYVKVKAWYDQGEKLKFKKYK